MYSKGAIVYLYLIIAIGVVLVSTFITLGFYVFSTDEPQPGVLNTSVIPSDPNGPITTHLACISNTCTVVAGEGADECTTIGLSCAPRGSSGGGGGSGGSGGGSGSSGGSTGTSTTQCSDNQDNDNDGALDLNDFSCLNAQDNDESSPRAECQDGIDNDNDGKIDFGLLATNDPECDSFQNDREDGQWIRLNGGNPLDIYKGQTDVLHISNNEVFSARDANDNVWFTIPNNEYSSTLLGRFNVATKAWEVRSFSGWSSNPTYSLPLGESRWALSKIRLFPDPSNANGFIGTMAAVPKAGTFPYNVHGGMYGFSLTEQGLRTWSPNGGYAENGQSLGYSHIHTGSHRQDSDISSSTGLALNALSGAPWPESLSASKYDVATKTWKTWVDGSWQSPPDGEQNSEHAALPFFNSSYNAHSPVVRALQGTNDFIITYAAHVDYSQPGTLKAARYDAMTNTWRVWNNGWRTGGTSQDLLPISSGYVARRVSFTMKDSIMMFYNSGEGFTEGTITMGVYNNTQQTFTFSPVVTNAGAYVAAPDSQGVIWMVYRADDAIYLKTYRNATWSTPRKIMTGDAVRIPVGIDMVNGRPIVFFTEGSNSVRLYVMSPSSSYWQTEHPYELTNQPPPHVLLPSNQGNINTSFDTFITMNITYNGQSYSSPTSYGALPCQNMAIDAEYRVYCPKFSGASSIGIFPNGYHEPPIGEFDPANSWGSHWDYFFFTSGVAIDNRREKVYISDSVINQGQGNVMPVGVVQIWDKSLANEDVSWWFHLGSTTVITTPTYLPTIMTAPNNARFNWPTDVAVDESRAILYVVESLNHRILIFDVANLQAGLPQYIGSFGTPGSGNGQFSLPSSIDLDNQGNLYVLDSNNQRIQKFNADHEFVKSWGSLGKEEGQFFYPFSLAVDVDQSYIYVSDPYNYRVQIFTTEGDFVSTFNTWVQNGQERSFDRIFGLVARNGTLYVNAQNLIHDGEPEPTLISEVSVFKMNLPPRTLQLSPEEAPTSTIIFLVSAIVLMALIIGLVVRKYTRSR